MTEWVKSLYFSVLNHSIISPIGRGNEKVCFLFRSGGAHWPSG